MEVAEVRVDFQRRLHDFETIGEGHVEGSPHLLGDFAEGAGAIVDFLVELGAALVAAAEVVEEDVAGAGSVIRVRSRGEYVAGLTLA